MLIDCKNVSAAPVQKNLAKHADQVHLKMSMLHSSGCRATAKHMLKL